MFIRGSGIEVLVHEVNQLAGCVTDICTAVCDTAGDEEETGYATTKERAGNCTSEERAGGPRTQGASPPQWVPFAKRPYKPSLARADPPPVPSLRLRVFA